MILFISRKLILSHKSSVEIYNGNLFPGKAILLANLDVFLPLSLLRDMLCVCVSSLTHIYLSLQMHSNMIQNSDRSRKPSMHCILTFLKTNVIDRYLLIMMREVLLEMLHRI